MEHASARQLGAKPGFFGLAAGDVFAYSFQGGGGFGDPIDRDPDAVLADTIDGFVTLAAALQHYGVAIDAGSVNTAATEEARAGIRRERLGGSEPPRRAAAQPAGDGDIAYGPYLVLDPSSAIRCSCGESLAEPGGDWKDTARTTVVPPEDHGPHVRLHEDLELREQVCPGCGTLLEAEVVRRDAPSTRSVEVMLDGEATVAR
jgi:N-methylhydantoinase B